MRAKTDLTRADLEKIKRLKRVAARRCRASSRRQNKETRKCPRCSEEGVRLLALIGPDIILECPKCSEVWKEVLSYV